jgi:hypothetical protein
MLLTPPADPDLGLLLSWSRCLFVSLLPLLSPAWPRVQIFFSVLLLLLSRSTVWSIVWRGELPAVGALLRVVVVGLVPSKHRVKGSTAGQKSSSSSQISRSK